MFNKKFSTLILISLCLSFASANEVNQNIIDSKTLKRIGYKTTEQHIYNAGLCDRYEKPFIISTVKRYHEIKSRKAMHDHKNTYYRFTFIQEEYESEALAKRRMEQMTFPYSFETDSLYSKSCGLRSGFQFKNKVYFLVTDAGLFSNELDPLLEKLKKEITHDKK